MQYLRTVAEAIEGICDMNDLLGERSTVIVDESLDAARELLSKALVKDQKDRGGVRGQPL